MRSLHTALVCLLALLAGPSAGTPRQETADYGFSLAPGEGMIQVVAPDGTLTIVTYWDAQGVMTVQGLMDNTDVIDPDAGSVMMASPSSRGTATFTIQGASLTLGRHILELEASLSGTPTTLTVFVYSAEPPTDLVVHDLVDGQAVYRFGDMQIYLTASLTAGSDLEVEWFIGDDLFVYQQYDQADTSVTIAQQWPFDTLLPVTLIVFNQQTTIATQFELHIVWALNTLGVSPTSEISALPGDLITLTLTFYDGVRTPMAPILMTVTWDTDTAVNYTLGPISGGYFIDFSHTYTTQGDRSISVVLRTPVDSVGYTRPARIWEEVNVELLTSTSFTVTRDVITLTFVSNSSHGFQYEIDYGEGTLTNNRSAMFEAYAAPSPPLTISYTSNGIYTVHLRAFNDKYSCESSKTITVQTVITADDMVLSPNPAVVAFPDGDVQLTLDVTSSSVEGDVDCSWDFGDASGTTLPAQKLYLPTDFPVETPFQYSGPGNFTVTLLCANNVSSFNLTSEVIVKDWEITDFDLVLDSTQAMNGMVVTEITPFNLTLMDIMNPPSGLTATFTYGDGSPPETLNVNSWEFNHMYPTRGVYSGSLLLEHAVKGSTTLDFIMRLGIFQPSVGSLGGLVETHIFDFVVNVPDGFSGTATVDFGDGNSATVPDITAGNDLIYRHSYAAVGFYNAHMTGTWLTETEAVDFEDTIEVDGSVSDLLITLSPENILFPPGETEATVLLNRAVHRLMFAECHVDFNEELDPAPRNWSGPMEPGDSFTIPFAYLTLGSKAVSLNCSNKFSEFSTVVYALAYNPCFSDDPIFDRQYGQWHSPMYVLNSVDLLLVTRTVILCPTSVPDFHWWLHEYSEDGVFLRDREDLVQPEVDYLMKRRGELEPGLYKLTLNISFGPEHDNIWLQESTFVQIVRAPLVAEISGGNIRDAGTDLDLIDARSLSYDPVTGIDDKEGLQFIWKCKQFATNSLAELLPFTSQRNYSDMGTCDDISTEELPGQRRLSLDSSVAAVGILFQVALAKDAAVSEPATLFLQFSRTSLTVEMRCVVNCDVKTAVTSPFVLQMVCLTCGEADMLDSQYEWALSILNDNDTFEDVPNVHAIMLESGYDNGQATTIAENSLEPCQRYRLQGRMTSVASGFSGTAVREFVTNCPPWGGTCDIDPREGDMMTQRFTLRCSGWIDEGFIDPTNNASTTTPPPVSLYYKYMLRKNGIIVPIAEGGESNMPRTQLPLIPGQIGSDYEMVARIYDPLQDYTEVVQPVNLFVVHNSSTEFSEVLNFWGGQAYYTDHSSTITKQLRGLTTASALLSTYDIPDDRSELEKAADGNAENGSHVVSQNWTKLWHDLNNPVTSMEKTNLTKMTEAFTKMVERRDEESANLTGLGITALGEGMATILFNSAITDTEAVIASADIADKGTEAMRKIFSTRPYPIGAKLSEAVFSMTGLVDRVLDSSLPTYDLSLGTDVIFNSSDIGEDDRAFLLERIKKSAAVKENRRIETTKTVMPKLEKTLDTMFDSLLTTAVLGQPTVTVDRGNIGLAAAKLTGRSLAAKHFIARNFDLSLDTVDEDGEESDEDATVEVKATVFERNPFAWSSDGSSYDITSPVVKLDLKDKNGHRKLRNITMRIKRNAAARTRTKRSAQTPGGIPNMETYSTNDTRAGDDQLIYHRLSVQSTSSAVVTYFKPPAHLTTVVAYYRQGRPPTLDRHDARVEGERDVSRKRRAAPDVTTGATDTDVSSTDGEPYKFYVPAGSLRPGEAFVGIYLPELGNETVEYEYMTFTDSCRVWNEEEEIWDSSSCTVSAFSTAEETVCICGDPPSMTFGSGFFVAPTTIDFDLVFLKFDPTNASVYGTLIGLFLVWILALLWARRKDRQDKNRWLVGYLKDNLVDDSYFYLLTVHTGLRRGAGTRSNVKFIITGERGDSGVRALSDGKRYLETGSVMTYIMATTESLGDLRYVRVWHDDSGPGEEASWFLGKFIVEDLQSAERFMFVCDRWLAIDKEDGLVDRILPIAGKDDVMTFDKLFSEHARVGVTDSHLWLSCFLRPDRSTFTRLQRVSCCMGLLLLTMITSAMFYQPEDSETGESPNKMGTEIEIGIMRFSMTTLWTSTVSIVITTIPTLLFVLLFRFSRPRRGPRAQTQQHRREGLIRMTHASKTITDKKKRDEMDKNTSDLLDTVLMENPLPHFVTYITWVLLLLTMVACSFFLLLYSMQWGKATSEEWIGSFFLSFMESIFVLDPIKVMLVACLLAFCARNPHAATKHQFVDMKRVQVEAETFGAEEMDPTAVPPDPVPKSVLEAARERRHQEQLAQQVFFELLLYSFFVLCIFSVSYGNRDYRTYMTNTHLENILYSASGTAPVPFETIGKREDVMEWLDKTLLTTLFPWTNLIGQELDWKRRLFASDFVSFRVGPVRVRQLRMPSLGYPKVTRMYPELKDDKVPFPPYNMVDEDKESYCLGWKPRPCSDTELSSKLSGPAWSHTPMKNVTDMPVWGTFALYSAGGYAVDFAVNRDIVANTIQELTENQWLDLQTRAVFVEFCLYNANINLFTFVRLAAEFPEVGSAVVWRDIKTLRIYNHLGPLGAYMFICELISVIVVIVFTVKVVISLKKMKCKFFRDFWKVLDLGVVLFAYVALAFYIVKTLAVDETMELWRLDPKVYIDFYLTVLWDDIYGFILAGLVFVVTIRLLRVLGYNKRITMIGTVLAKSGVDLLGFSVVFMVIIMAYVSAGVTFFAGSMYEFRTVWDSFFTLYLVLLGKNVLGRFIQEASLFAQAYFISLTVLVILILYTMFQAILCNTTVLVRSDILKVPPPYGLADILHKFYRAALADWIPSWLVRSNQAAVKPTEPVAEATRPGGFSAANLPPVHQDDNRTQPHRVLAAIFDHFNKTFDALYPAACREARYGASKLDPSKTHAHENHVHVPEQTKMRERKKPKREKKAWEGFSSLKTQSCESLV